MDVCNFILTKLFKFFSSKQFEFKHFTCRVCIRIDHLLLYCRVHFHASNFFFLIMLQNNDLKIKFRLYVCTMRENTKMVPPSIMPYLFLFLKNILKKIKIFYLLQIDIFLVFLDHFSTLM